MKTGVKKGAKRLQNAEKCATIFLGFALYWKGNDIFAQICNVPTRSRGKTRTRQVTICSAGLFAGHQKKGQTAYCL